MAYSGLFSLVENFREKLEEALRIKFCDFFQFRGALFLAYNVMWTRYTWCKFWFQWGTRSQTLTRKVWLHETRAKMERFSVKSCVGGYHVYKAQTPLVLACLNERYCPRSCFWLVHFSVHFLHHHTQDSLRKGTLQIKGTVNRAQVAKKTYKKRCPVQMLGWKISWHQG